MNRLLTIVVPVVLVAVIVPSAYAARSILVAVAPGMPDADRQSVLRSCQNLVLGADPGDVVQVYDAAAQRRLCVLTVPKSASPRARLVTLKPELAAVNSYLKGAASRGDAPCALNVPAFMTMVVPSQHAEGQTTRVIVFGSVFHGDERDIGATFSSGAFPSDGCALASSRDHPFGTADRKGTLAGVSVDWCFLEEQCGTLERRAAVRWWTVWCAELGATLTSCQATPNVAVENALKGATAPVSADTIDRTNTEVAIRAVRPAGQPAEGPARARSAASNEALAEVAAASPAPRDGYNMTISAVWTSPDGQADCDLWVRPRPDAPVIFYGAPESPDGRLLRDVVRSGGRRDADWTAFWERVELRAVSLRDTECYIDLFSNTGAPVNGLVRLRFEGRTTDIPFSFGAGVRGDATRDHGRRDLSPCWVRIDLAGHATHAAEATP